MSIFRLTVHNFKCYADQVWDFYPNQVVLISGRSGAGKSTIVESILWCLYADGYKVLPNNRECSTCHVMIQTSYPEPMIIIRQKKPEILKVIINNQEFTGVVAQNIIDSKWGPKFLWIACCYSPQKEHCSLLVESQNDRFEILNRLAFSNDDPKKYIDAIEIPLAQAIRDYEMTKLNYTNNLSSFQNFYNSSGVTNDDFANIANLEKLGTEFSQKLETRNKLKLDWAREEQKRVEIEKLKLRLQQLTLQINQLGNLPENPNELNDKKHYIMFRLRLDPLKRELENLPAITENEQELEQNLMRMRSEMLESQRELTNAKNLGVKYDTESIENEIKMIQEKLEKQPEIQRKLQSNLEYNQLVSKKNEVVNYIATSQRGIAVGDKIKDDDITNEATKLKMLEAGLNIIKCPGCGKGLRYNFNKLELAEDPGSTNKDVEICKRNLEEMKKIKVLSEAIEKYVQFLNDIESKLSKLKFEQIDSKDVLNNADIMRLQNRILELKRIKIVPQVNFDTREIEEKVKIIKKRNELQIRLTEVISTRIQGKTFLNDPKINILGIISEIERNKPKICEEIQNFSYAEVDAIDKLIPKIMQLNSLKNSKSEVERQLSSITFDESMEEKLKSIENELPELEKKVQRVHNAKILAEQYKLLQQEENKVNEKYKRVVGFTKLKDKALQTELGMLTSIVECINSTLNELSKYFFEAPILIRLQLFKELKSQHRVKPSVNLHISYCGADYEGTKGLSGGEVDRISVCLLIALFKLSYCPLLILDEAMSIDSDSKVNCVEGIRKVLEGRPAVCLEHDVVKGSYDRYIQL